MGTLTETNPSLWVATSPGEERPALGHDLDTDIVVVGAGITGLLTAWLLHGQGARVAVLESGHVCSGTTGYTTAKVTALHGLVYSDLTNWRGQDVAAAYARAQQSGLELVSRLVHDLQIDCDWSGREAFTYTTSSEQVPRILEEVDAAQKSGLDATFVTSTDLGFEIAGAVKLAHQGQFHPRLFCLGLASALESAGVRVFERSRALEAGEADGRAFVVTEDARVTADYVVLATHLPITNAGMFFAKCWPSRSYAMAVRVNGTMPRGMYLSTDDPVRSLRSALDDSVLIVGGEGHKVGEEPDSRAHYEALETWARSHFDVSEIINVWSAQDYMPVDHTPFVGHQKQGSKVLVATGYQKWGMTNGAAAAMVLSDIVGGRSSEHADIFDARRIVSPLTAVDFYRENLDVAKSMVKDRVGSLSASDSKDLERGCAGIVTHNGEKVAAYRDPDGTLHAVSPSCTHLGCLVRFNHAERTWDCPCHGSRFTLQGAVIEGPAVRDLEGKR